MSQSQNTLDKQLGKIILAHGFRGFSSWSAGSIVSGGNQTTVAEDCGETELFSSWQSGSRETVRGEGAGDKIYPSKHTPSDLLSSGRPHLLVSTTSQ
jgi:hypothetical protein